MQVIGRLSDSVWRREEVNAMQVSRLKEEM